MGKKHCFVSVVVLNRDRVLLAVAATHRANHLLDPMSVLEVLVGERREREVSARACV